MSDPIEVVPAIAAIRAAVSTAKAAGRTVALVPTMGALHAGHAGLIRAAKRRAGFVVVSIFVNPTQFGPTEDFGKYPRTLDADRALCAEAGADSIFAPSAAAMYPDGFGAFVEVPNLDGALCGARRPGHFRGVCTVVLKLFHIVRPDIALFGAKDAQQCIILKKMVRDLDVPVELQIAPTVREVDGLAMSSRNRYLSPAERSLAPRIYAALQSVRRRAAAGERDVAALRAGLRSDLAAIPGASVDYAEILDAESLETIDRLAKPALAAAAVFLGGTRLIDNVILSG